MSVKLRLAIAVIISGAIVTAIAVFFLVLAERFTGFVPAEDIQSVIVSLGDTEWQLNSSNRKKFENVFFMEAPHTMHIVREGKRMLVFSFDDISTVVAPLDGYLTGFLNGVRFSASVSISPAGEGEALSLLVGDELIVFH